jgi:hypothetical protein
MCRASANPLERIEAILANEVPVWLTEQPATALGSAIIKGRQLIDRIEAVNGEATRRFEKAQAYKADGALGMVPWMKAHCKLNGGAAAEHVETARQLAQLPRTEEALARGEIGYQHAVAMAKTAEHVGAAQVRKAETRARLSGRRSNRLPNRVRATSAPPPSGWRMPWLSGAVAALDPTLMVARPVPRGCS